MDGFIRKLREENGISVPELGVWPGISGELIFRERILMRKNS